MQNEPKTYTFVRTIERIISQISNSLKNQLNDMSKPRTNEQKAFVDEIFNCHQLLMKALIITRYLISDRPYIDELIRGTSILQHNISCLCEMTNFISKDIATVLPCIRVLPYEVEAALEVLLEHQFNSLPRQIHNLINLRDSFMDPTPNFTKLTIYLRKLFYLCALKYPFDSVDIVHGMLVCKTPQYSVFLTLRNPSVIYEEHSDNISFEVVSIYPTEQEVNWQRMNTTRMKDCPYLLDNLNKWINEKLEPPKPIILNGIEIKQKCSEDEPIREFNILKSFLDKYVVFLHKHILESKSQSSKLGYPYLLSQISKREHNFISRTEIYYWGKTASSLDHCPQGYKSLERPCLIYEYFPKEYRIQVTHNPSLPIQLDSKLSLTEQLIVVTEYLTQQYKEQLQFESTPLYPIPSFVLSPLTGRIKLYNVGLPPSLVEYFETLFSIGINHPSVLKTAMTEFKLRMKYASLHTIALMHSQASRLEEPQIVYIEKKEKESLIRGFPLTYRLSDFTKLYVTIENNIVKMELQVNGECIDDEYSNTYIWESFDNLYEYFFTSFEILLQKAYNTTFPQIFLHYFNTTNKDTSFNIVYRNETLYVYHLLLPFVQKLSISIDNDLQLTIKNIPTKIYNLVNDDGDYVITTPKTFIDDDINILLSKYATLFQVTLFASFIGPDEVTFENKEVQFTENSVIIPNTLSVTFTSSNPEIVIMECKVITDNESEQSLFESMNSHRIHFIFDSPKLSIQQFLTLRYTIQHLLMSTLSVIVNHPMTLKTEYQLDIYNFFVFTYQCDNSSHRYPSFYRFIHHFDNQLQVCCKPFKCVFERTIERSLPKQDEYFTSKELPNKLSLVHAISHLSILASLLTTSPASVVDQNNCFKLEHFIVSSPLRLDGFSPVITLKQSESASENSRIFAEYFNDRFTVPFNSNSISAAALYISTFITISRFDFSNEISILPRTYLESKKQMNGFYFDFSLKPTGEKSLSVELIFTMINGNRFKIGMTYTSNGWYIMQCEPMKNGITTDFRGHLRLLLNKQDNSHASDGLFKIIQDFKDNRNNL
ncbi:Hypothetical protein EHI5A_044790 [Entamoeba histolytica KU27]|uniref:Mediator of RNA polymerase II transcription subunit 14 n=1 Tax=Entamoeba histolytica KU27 TaxID=885311 RepID=M2SE14_ENTHI|nr:Hypothetical protein EHI5A_044790 [Entamoeba histolytica KU27]